MRQILKAWWDGKYVPPENYPDSGLVFMMGSYHHHWTSWLAHVVSDFWLKYWQWCMGFGLAVVGLIWKH
jgi:hypothetical protein